MICRVQERFLRDSIVCHGIVPNSDNTCVVFEIFLLLCVAQNLALSLGCEEFFVDCFKQGIVLGVARGLVDACAEFDAPADGTTIKVNYVARCSFSRFWMILMRCVSVCVELPTDVALIGPWVVDR